MTMRRLPLMLIFVIVLCCSLLFLYRFLLDFDNSRCYYDDAEYYHVKPTYADVRNAILEDVQKNIKNGMEVDQVVTIIHKTKNFNIVQNIYLEESDFRLIKVEVRTCFFPNNNIYLVYSFSNRKYLYNVVMLDPD